MKNNDKLTVKEAEQEYHHKGHCLRDWIRKNYVNAEKQGDGYLIDRVSLEEYLAKKKSSAGQETSLENTIPHKDEQVADGHEQPQDAQPGGVSKFAPPPNLWAGAQAMVTKAEPPLRESPPHPSALKPIHGQATEKKRSEKEDKKRYKKGPVRYAKDVMRHLDILQMMDVIRWLQTRIEAKIPKHVH